MPQYYFDVFDGRTATDDEFGDVLVDASEAMDQAASLLMDVARSVVPRDRAGDVGIIVRDEWGVDLYWAALMFRESQVDPARSRHLRAVASPAAGAADLILRSRRLRTEVDAAWGQFLGALAEVSRTIDETQKLTTPSEAQTPAAG